MSEPKLVRYKVTGALPIRDAVTRESVRPGGVVHLDPTRTNIAALIEGGSLDPKSAAEVKAPAEQAKV